MAYKSLWLHEYTLESHGGKPSEEIPGIYYSWSRNRTLGKCSAQYWTNSAWHC